VRADNSHHLRAAAQRRATQTRERAIRALRRLDATGRLVTMESVAREAGVSRSWLYGQADLRAEIQRLRASQGRPSYVPIPARQRATDASLRQRLQAANQRLRGLVEENRRLREQLASVLRELRAATTRYPTPSQPDVTPQRGG
jgi:hypothetical protein